MAGGIRQSDGEGRSGPRRLPVEELPKVTKVASTAAETASGSVGGWAASASARSFWRSNGWSIRRLVSRRSRGP